MSAVVGTIGISSNGRRQAVPLEALPVIQITATDATATEAGVTTGEFTITSSTPAPAGGINVSLTYTGTATSVDDYLALPTLVTILEGNTSIAVLVTPVDDLDIEGPETVIATIQPTGNITIGMLDTATVSIVDNSK